MLPEKDPYLKKTLIVLSIAIVYRLILIGLYPMGPDEASYWTWSCKLDLGYVDHPPLVAYAIRLMTTIFGDTNWASRILACAFSGGFKLVFIPDRQNSIQQSGWVLGSDALHGLSNVFHGRRNHAPSGINTDLLDDAGDPARLQNSC